LPVAPFFIWKIERLTGIIFAANGFAVMNIIPDVLAHHVCPFLGNRDRANMLQLCRAVQRDLVARKEPSHIWYQLHNADIMNCAENMAMFKYMKLHGARHLSINASLLNWARKLDTLRDLQLINVSGVHDIIRCINMSASLERLNIQDVRGCTIACNLDHMPKLQSLIIDSSYTEVKLSATAPPQCLTHFELHVILLTITRDAAAHLMAAPGLTHVDMYIHSSTLAMFDGLHAPALTNFSSRGGWEHPHEYDLHAPQLRILHDAGNSCLPKSAPNITHIHTQLYDLTRYAHLAKLTHLHIEEVGDYISYLPPQLEELCISGGHADLTCALPKTLKVIRLLNGCKLRHLPEYTGEIISELAVAVKLNSNQGSI
jgi:hypothetical protein